MIDEWPSKWEVAGRVLEFHRIEPGRGVVYRDWRGAEFKLHFDYFAFNDHQVEQMKKRFGTTRRVSETWVQPRGESR